MQRIGSCSSHIYWNVRIVFGTCTQHDFKIQFMSPDRRIYVCILYICCSMHLNGKSLSVLHSHAASEEECPAPPRTHQFLKWIILRLHTHTRIHYILLVAYRQITGSHLSHNFGRTASSYAAHIKINNLLQVSLLQSNEIHGIWN